MQKLIIGNVVKWKAVAKQAFEGCPSDSSDDDDICDRDW